MLPDGHIQNTKFDDIILSRSAEYSQQNISNLTIEILS